MRGAMRRARADLHALDHIDRGHGLEVFVEIRGAVDQLAVGHAALPGQQRRHLDLRGRFGGRRVALRGRRRQREGVEGPLQGAHGDGPQPVALLDGRALLADAQHSIDCPGRGRLDDRLDTAAATGGAAAARME